MPLGVHTMENEMGSYSNEDGLYFTTPDYDKGDWFLCPAGKLYIVPEGIAETIGPDNFMIEQIDQLYRDDARNPQTVASELGLQIVPGYLQRHDPLCGYFTA